jgi:hypothetical protein
MPRAPQPARLESRRRPAISIVMSAGRINSPQAIELGKRLVAAYGDWAAVEAAAELGDDGVYRVRLPAGTAAQAAGTRPRP